jgi:hypothetical protein
LEQAIKAKGNAASAKVRDKEEKGAVRGMGNPCW